MKEFTDVKISDVFKKILTLKCHFLIKLLVVFYPALFTKRPTCICRQFSLVQLVTCKTSAVDYADFLKRVTCEHVEVWSGGNMFWWLSAELKVKFVHA